MQEVKWGEEKRVKEEWEDMKNKIEKVFGRGNVKDGGMRDAKRGRK